MSKPIERISEWSQRIENYQAVAWDRLPEIYLYMDQVLTFMEKQLSLFERDEHAGLLSSSMINNYVKAGVLPRPESKKYNRSHLALLTIVCLLKQVLSLQDIHALLKTSLDTQNESELYDAFCKAQKTSIEEVCKRVDSAAKEGDSTLTKLAMDLSIEADARRVAAERILSEQQKGTIEKNLSK